MRRRVAAVLVVAAVAVAIENAAYLSAFAPAPVDAVEASADPSSEAGAVVAPGAIARVCANTLAGFLAALPDLERARSSFLTRAEASELAASGASGDAVDLPVLEGTLVNPQRRVAWLDGIAASEGGWVGEHELLRIESRAVVVKKGAGEIRIELRTPAPEKPES